MKPERESPNYDPLLCASDVRKECGNISEVTLWRWEKQGVISPPVRINDRKYWRRSVVQKLKGET